QTPQWPYKWSRTELGSCDKSIHEYINEPLKTTNTSTQTEEESNNPNSLFFNSFKAPFTPEEPHPFEQAISDIPPRPRQRPSPTSTSDFDFSLSPFSRDESQSSSVSSPQTTPPTLIPRPSPLSPSNSSLSQFSSLSSERITPLTLISRPSPLSPSN